MSNERHRERLMAAHGRLDELSGITDGWWDGQGVAITRAAIDSSRRILRTYQNIAINASIFPTMHGGIEMQVSGYPLCAEVRVGPNAGLWSTMDKGGIETSVKLKDLDDAICDMRSFRVERSQTLIWYDGPVAMRMRHCGNEIIAIALADEDPLGDYIGVLMQGRVREVLEKGIGDLRSVIQDPRSVIFSITRDASGMRVKETFHEVLEISLPGEGLMLTCLTEDAYEQELEMSV